MLLCRFIVHKEIDLTNPHLGSELLKDPQGDFPLDVWEAYCTPLARSTLDLLPLLSWRIDPSDPKSAALDPQQAVDEAFGLVAETVFLLRRSQPAKALESAEQTLQILARAKSSVQPKRGARASMRHFAVRAWIIRKFNSPSEARWWKLANMLFLKEDRCPRCRLTRHQYNSACVNALRTAVGNLVSAMEDAGIPTSPDSHK